ncbi:MAG: hypothetical protein GC156_11350 [Actinomycetales bacterium]|nr:hypothetical protein [Actinomycetales bacterium]
MNGEGRRPWHAVLVTLVACLAALTVLASPVRYTEADTRGTLLVSEQLVRHGTVTLDAFGRDYLASRYNFYERDGHYYDYFPIGTSLVAAPFVGLAIVAGVDVFDHRAQLEIAIASLAAALTVLLLFAVARRFLPFATSLLLAAAAWWGTTLASTGGTALWSHDFAVVFALLALLTLVRMTQGEQWRLWPLLSAALFAAYLCRPTMALLAPFALGLVLVRRPAAGGKAVARLAVLAGAFVLASNLLYGAWPPPYYQPQRLGTDTFGEALLGHLVSPSRGLLVFTPVLVLLPLFAIRAPAQARRYGGLLVVALGWPLAHWIVVARHPQWYGGFSYGPRLMTDVLPGLFLAFVLVWPRSYRTWPARLLVGAAAVLAAFGVWVHTVQGLYNVSTAAWNEVPRIEDDPAKAWDWRYPQWLQTPEREAERRAGLG